MEFKVQNNKRSRYHSPGVLDRQELYLEQSLLVGSIVMSSFVETAGQESDGFYSEGDIVTSENYWGD